MQIIRTHVQSGCEVLLIRTHVRATLIQPARGRVGTCPAKRVLASATSAARESSARGRGGAVAVVRWPWCGRRGAGHRCAVAVVRLPWCGGRGAVTGARSLWCGCRGAGFGGGEPWEAAMGVRDSRRSPGAIENRHKASPSLLGPFRSRSGRRGDARSVGSGGKRYWMARNNGIWRHD
jgi:hypothetical protein